MTPTSLEQILAEGWSGPGSRSWSGSGSGSAESAASAAYEKYAEKLLELLEAAGRDE